MSIRYVTIDPCARLLEVTYLRDRFDKPTKDPVLAERCIVQVEDHLIAMTTDEVPIYTVH